MEIKNLSEILGKSVAKFSIKPLTKAGDNYGSLIGAVEATLDDGSVLNVVAKMHPRNPLTVKIFMTPITFKKELEFYTVVVRTLENFQQEYDLSVMDIFPKILGGRISLNPDSEEVDEDAAIILENLKTKGYVVGDKVTGFDEPSTEFIVRKLAVFHAVPIAYKIHHPQEFKQIILPVLKRANFFAEPPPFLDSVYTEVINCLERGAPELLERGKKYLNKPIQQYGSEGREPFSTIGHNDYWVNNMLLRYENGEPKVLKMVDFQVVDYGSPVRDLLFFIFTSVQQSVIDTKLDYIIDVYYQTFIDTLKIFNCDVDCFSRDKFNKEIEIETKDRIFHIVMFILLLHLNPDKAVDVSDASEENPPEVSIANCIGDVEGMICNTFRILTERKWI